MLPDTFDYTSKPLMSNQSAISALAELWRHKPEANTSCPKSKGREEAWRY